MASKWGKANMVTLLLDSGAAIENHTRDGLTPLHCAARSGHDQVVDLLVERGAAVDSKTKVVPRSLMSCRSHSSCIAVTCDVIDVCTTCLRRTS